MDNKYYKNNKFYKCFDYETLEILKPIEWEELSKMSLNDMNKIINKNEWDWLGEDFEDMEGYLNFIMIHNPTLAFSTKISDKDEYDHNSFKGLIKSVIFSGTHTRYKILIKNIELECSLQSVGINNIKENDEIYVHLPKNKIWGMND